MLTYDFLMEPVFEPQAAFERVWQHFVIEHGPPGVDASSGRCALIAPNGARCSIGLCAGPLVRLTHVVAPEWFIRTSMSDHAFFYALRNAHDRSANSGRAGLLRPLEDFYRLIDAELRVLAYDYHLDIPEPVNV